MNKILLVIFLGATSVAQAAIERSPILGAKRLTMWNGMNILTRVTDDVEKVVWFEECKLTPSQVQSIGQIVSALNASAARCTRLPGPTLKDDAANHNYFALRLREELDASIATVREGGFIHLAHALQEFAFLPAIIFATRFKTIKQTFMILPRELRMLTFVTGVAVFGVGIWDSGVSSLEYASANQLDSVKELAFLNLPADQAQGLGTHAYKSVKTSLTVALERTAKRN